MFYLLKSRHYYSTFALMYICNFENFVRNSMRLRVCLRPQNNRKRQFAIKNLKGGPKGHRIGFGFGYWSKTQLIWQSNMLPIWYGLYGWDEWFTFLSGEIKETKQTTPASANNFETSPIRRIFSSRSANENPKSLLRPWRTLSPSKT